MRARHEWPKSSFDPVEWLKEGGEDRLALFQHVLMRARLPGGIPEVFAAACIAMHLVSHEQRQGKQEG